MSTKYDLQHIAEALESIEEFHLRYVTFNEDKKPAEQYLTELGITSKNAVLVTVSI